MTFYKKYTEIYNLVKPDINIINGKLTENISLPQELDSAVKNFLSAPSKKIRVVVSLLFLKMTKTEISEKILSHLAATELVHNASLIHDDVIDDDNLRRNIKTLNCEYNNKLAVIIGDYILSIVLEKINAFDNTQIIRLYAKTLQNMCIGEVNQYFNTYKITSVEEYIKKTEQKTSSLFEAALLGSLILADTKYSKNALSLARNFGIAFQIRDDLLNAEQKDKSKSAADIENGIYNAPVILGGSTDNIKIGIEKTRFLLENYIEEGKKSITDFEDNIYKQALIMLLELLKND